MNNEMEASELKIHVKVTDEDISAGIPQTGESCPVALSLKRWASERAKPLSKGKFNVHVDSDGDIDIWVYGDDISYLYQSKKTPDAVKTFIEAFDEDRKEEVKPFEFDLELTITPFQEP